MAKKNDNKEGDNSGLILFWASLISIFYLAVIIPISIGLLYKSTKPFEVNELGDWLAGAFAPLAFGWLAVAVLLQKSELKAQREELALTRQEMEAQREVMKQQAEEARASKEFIGKQTEILTSQHEIAQMNDADAAIDKFLFLCLRTYTKAPTVLLIEEGGPRVLLKALAKPHDIETELPTVFKQLQSLPSRITIAEEEMVNSPRFRSAVAEMLMFFEAIKQLAEKASPAKRAELLNLEFLAAEKGLRALCKSRLPELLRDE